MTIPFKKYHGTGNDFIVIDNTKDFFSANSPKTELLIKKLCHRHFGIGADGLILIERAPGVDFRMRYFNSDGRPGSFCGNGSRCAVAFALSNRLIKGGKTLFLTSDGHHEAAVTKQDGIVTHVRVNLKETRMPDAVADNMYFVDTGSPHVVLFVENLESIDAVAEGRQIRHQKQWAPDGTNVSFVKHQQDGKLYVKTYERGVENETLSCGSGAAAAAIAAHHRAGGAQQAYTVTTKGGELRVAFSPPAEKGSAYRNVSLEGPATFIFQGEFSRNGI